MYQTAYSLSSYGNGNRQQNPISHFNIYAADVQNLDRRKKSYDYSRNARCKTHYSYNEYKTVEKEYSRNPNPINPSQTYKSFYQEPVRKISYHISYEPTKQTPQKRGYLTHNDINLRQIGVKIQRILNRLDEEQDKYKTSQKKVNKSKHNVSPQTNAIDKWIGKYRQIDTRIINYQTLKEERKKKMEKIGIHANPNLIRERPTSPINVIQKNPLAGLGHGRSHETSSQSPSLPRHESYIRKWSYNQQILQGNQEGRNHRSLNTKYLSEKAQRIRTRHGINTHSESPLLQKDQNIMVQNRKIKIPQKKQSNLQDRVSRVAISKDIDDESAYRENFKQMFEKEEAKTGHMRCRTQPYEKVNDGINLRLKTEPNNPTSTHISQYSTNLRGEYCSPTTSKNGKQNPRSLTSEHTSGSDLKLRNGKRIDDAIGQIQVKIQKCKKIKDVIMETGFSKATWGKQQIYPVCHDFPKQISSGYVKDSLQETGEFKIRGNGMDVLRQNQNHGNVVTTNRSICKPTQKEERPRSVQKPSTGDNFLKQGKIEISRLIKALDKQISLDNDFSKAKKWLNSWGNPNKWVELQRNFKDKGITFLSFRQVEQIYQLREEENDPFYSFRDDHQTIDSLSEKYLKCQQHWIRNVLRKFDFAKLLRQGFQERVQSAMIDQQVHENENRQKTKANLSNNTITIANFIRLLNFELGQFYRIRDVFLVFQRISKGKRLTFRQMMAQLTDYQI